MIAASLQCSCHSKWQKSSLRELTKSLSARLIGNSPKEAAQKWLDQNLERVSRVKGLRFTSLNFTGYAEPYSGRPIQYPRGNEVAVNYVAQYHGPDRLLRAGTITIAARRITGMLYHNKWIYKMVYLNGSELWAL